MKPIARRKKIRSKKIILEALAKTATNNVVNSVVHKAVTKAKE
jgi:hypothetical protein